MNSYETLQKNQASSQALNSETINFEDLRMCLKLRYSAQDPASLRQILFCFSVAYYRKSAVLPRRFASSGSYTNESGENIEQFIDLFIGICFYPFFQSSIVGPNLQ